MRRAIEATRELCTRALNLTDRSQKDTWAKHALAGERRSRLANAVALAKSVEGISITADQLDPDPFLLNVLNA